MPVDVVSAFDHIFKVVVIGDSAVGKSSLVGRYTDDFFEEGMAATIGVDFKVKTVTVAEKKIKLTIWDTAGQERFRTLTGSYYRGAQIAILVFDVTNTNSFASITDTWMEEIEINFTHTSLVKVLIGNKIDQRPRTVETKDAVALAKKHEMLYIETSAKTKTGVKDAFDTAVKQTLLREDLVQSAPSVVNMVPVYESESYGTTGGCC
jgi:Ras-related protein Rab-18